HGDAHGPGPRRVLVQCLAPVLEMPRLERGIEAFVTVEACNILDYLQGWLVLQASNSRPSFMRMRGPDWKKATATDVIPLDPGILAEIESLGKRFSPSAPPRIHLLWNNSD